MNISNKNIQLRSIGTKFTCLCVSNDINCFIKSKIETITSGTASTMTKIKYSLSLISWNVTMYENSLLFAVSLLCLFLLVFVMEYAIVPLILDNILHLKTKFLFSFHVVITMIFFLLCIVCWK